MVYYPRSKKVIAKENAKEKVRKAKAEPLIRKMPISITLLKKMDGGNKLSDRLLSKLRGHSMHHSLKHMKQMVKDLSKGGSFRKSHKEAIKNVGV